MSGPWAGRDKEGSGVPVLGESLLEVFVGRAAETCSQHPVGFSVHAHVCMCDKD